MARIKGRSKAGSNLTPNLDEVDSACELLGGSWTLRCTTRGGLEDPLGISGVRKAGSLAPNFDLCMFLTTSLVRIYFPTTISKSSLGLDPKRR